MQTSVLSHYNFCPTVWNLCISSDTMKLDKVQHRALKCVLMILTVPMILRWRANVPLLCNRRRKAVLDYWRPPIL